MEQARGWGGGGWGCGGGVGGGGGLGGVGGWGGGGEEAGGVDFQKRQKTANSEGVQQTKADTRGKNQAKPGGGVENRRARRCQTTPLNHPSMRFRSLASTFPAGAGCALRGSGQGSLSTV